MGTAGFEPAVPARSRTERTRPASNRNRSRIACLPIRPCRQPDRSGRSALSGNDLRIRRAQSPDAVRSPEEGSTAYDYDPASNRIKAGATTYSFNDLNQLTSASDGTSYDYDAAGRLIEVDQGDPATELVQMGQRPYMPDTGAFLAEDPVLGRIGTGMTVDRYLYALDNPVNRYDLNGRDVCLFGGCIDAEDVRSIGEDLEGGVRTTEEGADAVGSAAGDTADDAWDWTAPGRSWTAERARDFWKAHGNTLEDIYNFAGAHWQECREGAKAGALGGAVIGAIVGPEGIPPGAVAGGVLGWFGTAGASAGLEEILAPEVGGVR